MQTALHERLDVNADGYADTIVAVPERHEIRTYLGGRSGPQSPLILTDTSLGESGGDLIHLGDVDGDGRSDIAARGAAGFWRVYYGGPLGFAVSRSSDIHDRSGDGGSSPDALFPVGDVNGDGLCDAAHAALSVGRSRSWWSVLPGSSNGLSPGIEWSGSSANLSAIGPIGDVDRDGFDDLGAVGYRDERATTQSLLALRGASDGPTWGVALDANVIDADSVTLRGRTDLNGDGVSDAVFRSPLYADHLNAVYLSSNASMPTTSVHRIPDESAIGDHALVDLNGDGLTDLAVAAPNAGQIVVFTGTPTGLATSVSARVALPNAARPTQLSSAGDIDGDGYGDIVVLAGSGQAALLYLVRGAAQLPPVAREREIDTIATALANGVTLLR